MFDQVARGAEVGRRGVALSLALAVGLSLGGCGVIQRHRTDRANAAASKLVDELTKLDEGLSDLGDFEVFLAVDAPPVFRDGILGAPAPTYAPAMRELVRHGADSLPILLAHLSDARPTRLVVGEMARPGGRGFLLWGAFSEEYRPRDRHRMTPAEERAFLSDLDAHMDRSFAPYAVTVGDACYFLIGQIVNRELAAVRYQPTGGIIVNSPVKRPELAEWVRGDWAGLDSAGLQASLLDDLRAEAELYFYGSALTRLRYYFPDAYAGLSGADLQKRQAFEAAEAKTLAESR